MKGCSDSGAFSLRSGPTGQVFPKRRQQL